MTHDTEIIGVFEASPSSRQSAAFFTATPPSGFTERVSLFCGFRRRVEVHGSSMAPTLTEGDVLLWNPKAYRVKKPAIGDVLLIKHPYELGRHMVKRLTQITEAGEETRYHLEGDNRIQSTDSRTFGTLLANSILGQITSRYSER